MPHITQELVRTANIREIYFRVNQDIHSPASQLRNRAAASQVSIFFLRAYTRFSIAIAALFRGDRPAR